MRKTVSNIVTEYGAVALVIYLAIFSTVLAGFWTAIRLGWQPASVTGNMGAFAAAYLATKVTQPARIAATVVLTPFAARVFERVSRRGGPSGADG